MRKRIVIASGILAIMVSGGIAQISIPGLPQLVFDPTMDSDLLAQTLKVIQEIEVLRQTLALTQQTYNQILFNANYLTGRSSWQYLMSPPAYASTPNLYGTSAGWIGAINSGLATADGYLLATIPATNPAAMIGALSSAGQTNFGAHYASIELSDSLTQNTMAVTGSVRGNMISQQSALTALQRSSFSEDPNNNSEVGVLNTISAATLIHAQSLQDNNQLLSVMADQATVANKVRRDTLVGEINNAVAAQASAAASNTALFDGSQAAHAARF